MKKYPKNETYSLSQLDWDSDYFGVSCGSLILNNEIHSEDWTLIKERLKEYDFVVIKNINANYRNAKILGQYTSSYLIDVNIQFSKNTNEEFYKEELDILDSKNDLIEQVYSIANFRQSRFILDEQLFSLGGGELYREWIRNSFDNPNKSIILITNEQRKVLGFALVLRGNGELTIELIGVNSNEKSKGVGTSLLKKIETYAQINKLNKIKVGTQVTNIVAMNFYNKMNFKQSEVHQVFHLWNS